MGFNRDLTVFKPVRSNKINNLYFNLVGSTLEGVSFPFIIVDELNAMALIISVILVISNVSISMVWRLIKKFTP